MAKAIFFNMSGSGHINPTLGLVAELIRQGERMVYYADDLFGEAISAAGAEFRPLPRIGATSQPVHGVHHLALLNLERSWAMLPELLGVTRQERPDYVLYDSMGPIGWLLSCTLQIPAVSSVSTFAFTPEVLQALPHPERLMQGASGQSEQLDYERQYMSLSAEIESSLGVPVPDWLRSFNLFGDLSLVYTSSAMQPAADLLDASFRLVGPVLRPSETVAGFPYGVLESENLIYIALGTVFNDRPDFYRRCLEGFAGSPYTILLSVGQTVDLAALGEVPANSAVIRFAPQLDVLKRARLFVTHGGMNSVHEALYHRVPLVVVPQMGEQAIVAGQVVANGAGLELETLSATAEQLRQAVDRVLAEGAFRENAARVGESLRAAGGAQRAAEEVLAWRARPGERLLQRQPDAVPV